MNQADLHVPENALNGIVTVGNFDGVHRGHQQMLQTLREIASERSAPAVVVTFDPHPLSLLRPDAALPRLTTIEQRTALLRKYGADHVIVLPVTRQLLQMTADDFFDQVLVKQLSAAGIVEGPNFRFGRDRRGDVTRLANLCQGKDITLQVMQPVDDEGEMISSSRIRTLLGEARLCDAVAMTGHAHRISGVVSRGAGRGRQLGFPTANLTNIRVMLPTNGVYAGTADIAGKNYVAAVSIGPNPTFDDNRLKVECYLDGFTGDLYETKLNIDLFSAIRPLCSFNSVEELIQQIRTDVEECRVQIARLTQPIYKICTKAEWQTAIAAGEFVGSKADLKDGFIHFSTAEQLKETATKHFSGQTDLVLVDIDPIRLGSALKWESSRKGDLFPHLYTSLPTDAARKAEPFS